MFSAEPSEIKENVPTVLCFASRGFQNDNFTSNQVSKNTLLYGRHGIRAQCFPASRGLSRRGKTSANREAQRLSDIPLISGYKSL